MPPAVIGAAIVAGGSIISSRKGAKAAESAAAAGERGAEAGIAEQRRQFDITQQQFEPFRQAGTAALEEQRILLGLGGTAPEDTQLTAQEQQAQLFARLDESPGQQFLRARGQRNLIRNAAALGGIGGGNVREALVQQGVGFAQQDLQNQFARLGQVAGQGQAAATSVGQLGAQTSGNVANLLGSAAQARASGILGQNQAFQQGISGVTTAIGQLPFFQQQPPPQPPPSQFGLPANGGAGFGQNFGQNFVASAFGGR